MAAGRMIAGFIAAVLATFVVASFAHTHFVLAGLRDLGVEIPPAVALDTARGDLVGLAPALGMVIAVALLLGFIVAGIARRFIESPRVVAFALAGAAALGVALALMDVAYNGITPLASARSWAGFLTLCAAGGLGGLVFAAISRRHVRTV